MDNNSNTLNINDAKFLSNELRKYLNTLNKLRCQLNELNSNVNVVNYDELNECIKKMRNIVVNVDDSLKWDIYNKIDELKKELETVEWELELIILNYGLQKFEIDDNDNNEELYDYIYQKIIQHLQPLLHHNNNPKSPSKSIIFQPTTELISPQDQLHDH